MSTRLQTLREELDALDTELVALFERRLEICQRIALVKREEQKAIRDEERERIVLDTRAAMIRDPRNEEPVRELMNCVMSLCRDRQVEILEGEKQGWSGTSF